MKFSHCSRGIIALAIVLAIFAYFFENPPAAIASAALVILLIIRAYLFLSALSSSASSIYIKRLLPALFIRQGSSVNVQTEIRIIVPPGFSVEISDLLPQWAVLSSGTNISPLQKGNSLFCLLNYTFTSIDPGEFSFEGICISLSDPFFSTELIFRTPDATIPSLIIFPSTEFQLSGRDPYGEKEAVGFRVLQNLDVRSFREYLFGDDLRKIDWKLSAKFDTLFIREYAGRLDEPTFLIIDLPDAGGPFSTYAFSRMREKALSAIFNLTLSKLEFSILLISGPNIISLKPFGTDIQRIAVLIDHLAPFPRLYHMYRYYDTASLKRGFSPLVVSREPFSRTLFHISSAFLSHRPSTSFESQITYIFQAKTATSAHLFTLANCDTSHIRIISKQAMKLGMNLQIHIPKESLDPVAWARISRSLGASVEVI